LSERSSREPLGLPGAVRQDSALDQFPPELPAPPADPASEVSYSSDDVPAPDDTERRDDIEPSQLVRMTIEPGGGLRLTGWSAGSLSHSS